MKGRYSMADKILDSSVIDDDALSTKHIAERLGEEIGTVQSALSNLYQNSKIYREVTTGGFKWRRCRIHWVWSTPMSRNPPKCLAERVWIYD